MIWSSLDRSLDAGSFSLEGFWLGEEREFIWFDDWHFVFNVKQDRM